VLAEFADGDLAITLAGPRGRATRTLQLRELFPTRFALARGQRS
jgi:hypothetical protein